MKFLTKLMISQEKIHYTKSPITHGHTIEVEQILGVGRELLAEHTCARVLQQWSDDSRREREATRQLSFQLCISRTHSIELIELWQQYPARIPLEDLHVTPAEHNTDVPKYTSAISTNLINVINPNLNHNYLGMLTTPLDFDNN